jgi:hypothetical protein
MERERLKVRERSHLRDDGHFIRPAAHRSTQCRRDIHSRQRHRGESISAKSRDGRPSVPRKRPREGDVLAHPTPTSFSVACSPCCTVSRRMSVFFLDEPNLSVSEGHTLALLRPWVIKLLHKACAGRATVVGLGSAEGTTTTWTGGYLTDQLTIEEGRKGTRQKELEGTG